MPEPTPLPDLETAYLDIDEAQGWAISVITAAHFEMPEYCELAKSAPPGGIASLSSIAISALQMYGQSLGIEPDDMIRSFVRSLTEVEYDPAG